LQPEPVSPELVLIDPELARRERARLEEKAYLKSVLDVAALRRAAESQPAPEAETVRRRAQWREATTFAKRRLVPAALLCSLAANGFFIAHVVTRGVGEEATQVAVRMVTQAESALTESALTESALTESALTESALTESALTESAPTVPPVSAVSTLPGTKAAVERKVVALILSAPARRLPHDLIDTTTGLVKNNVQVVCKKQRVQRRSFLCAVRLPSEGANNKALYVRYRTNKNGSGAFKWYGYKSS
jgi:hypothetical protein